MSPTPAQLVWILFGGLCWAWLLVDVTRTLVRAMRREPPPSTSYIDAFRRNLDATPAQRRETLDRE